MKSIGFTKNYTAQNKDSNSAKTRNNMYFQDVPRQVAVNRPKYLGITKHEHLTCLKRQKSEKTKSCFGEVLKSEFYLSSRRITSTKQKTEIPKKKEISTMDGDRLQKKLRIFKIIYDNLVKEGKTDAHNRAAKIVEKKFRRCSPKIGAIPGVKIGDKFNFRVELALVGLHMPPRSGIDTNFSVSSNNPNEHRVCTSIVVSDRFYENDMKDPDYLIYSGHGGMGMNMKKQVEDQKLVGGNLALMNSKRCKNEVRVIRTRKVDGRLVYVYDGLYVVETCNKVRGSSGKLVFKFGLKRIIKKLLPNVK